MENCWVFVWLLFDLFVFKHSLDLFKSGNREGATAGQVCVHLWSQRLSSAQLGSALRHPECHDHMPLPLETDNSLSLSIFHERF